MQLATFFAIRRLAENYRPLDAIADDREGSPPAHRAGFDGDKVYRSNSPETHGCIY